jgi:hypothetical protein
MLIIYFTLYGTFACDLSLTTLGESDLRFLDFSLQPSLETTFSIDEYISTACNDIAATTPTKYLGCYTFPRVSELALWNVGGTTLTSPYGPYNTGEWN